MEIIWYGHACFRLKDRGITILTDPYGRDLGYKLPRVQADVVTISHDHPGHNWAQGVKGKPRILNGPGEYEIRGVFITGIPTFHDNKRGARWGKNTVFLFEFDGLAVCHLGDIGHVPTQAQVEMLSEVDVLLIPVGGKNTINASQAAEVISALEPRLVIPMHYQSKALKRKLNPLARFLKEMGLKALPPQESLKVTKSSLPEETQVVVLAPKYG